VRHIAQSSQHDDVFYIPSSHEYMICYGKSLVLCSKWNQPPLHTEFSKQSMDHLKNEPPSHSVKRSSSVGNSPSLFLKMRKTSSSQPITSHHCLILFAAGSSSASSSSTFGKIRFAVFGCCNKEKENPDRSIGFPPSSQPFTAQPEDPNAVLP
jgi:hypothetical protein